MYWESITIIEAEQMLLQMKLNDYPHMKQADRKKVYKEISKLASPSFSSNKKDTVSLADFAKMLAGKA